jgi:hypothetical protein
MYSPLRTQNRSADVPRVGEGRLGHYDCVRVALCLLLAGFFLGYVAARHAAQWQSQNQPRC